MIGGLVIGVVREKVCRLLCQCHTSMDALATSHPSPVFAFASRRPVTPFPLPHLVSFSFTLLLLFGLFLSNIFIIFSWD